jgi:hypothetical protein
MTTMVRATTSFVLVPQLGEEEGLGVCSIRPISPTRILFHLFIHSIKDGRFFNELPFINKNTPQGCCLRGGI